jgi:hypothetical protein
MVFNTVWCLKERVRFCSTKIKKYKMCFPVFKCGSATLGFKGIVSRDFEVCVLVPLDRSERDRGSFYSLTGAHICYCFYHTILWNTIKSSKVSPGKGVMAQSAPLPGLIWALVAPCRSYICYYAEVQCAPHSLVAPLPGYEMSRGRSLSQDSLTVKPTSAKAQKMKNLTRNRL